MTTLHTVYTNAIEEIRQRLGEADISYFHFEIRAKGRTQTDRCEVEIIYCLSGEWGDSSVEGDTLENVITEFLRRKGWKDAHKPLRLTY